MIRNNAGGFEGAILPTESLHKKTAHEVVGIETLRAAVLTHVS